MVRVSVVVPAYNVERFVRECVESVLSQTMGDLEVICVDDGSTDGTADELESLRRDDPRVKVITRSNGGPSAARNEGVRNAAGRYLYFLDSDDALLPHALEALCSRMDDAGLDIAYFDAEVFFDDDRVRDANPGYESYYLRRGEYRGVMPGVRMMAAMTAYADWKPSVPMQCFRTAFFRQAGLRFEEGLLHEDNVLSLQAALAAQRVEYIASPLLRRRIRADSIVTGTSVERSFHDLLRAYLLMAAACDGDAFEPDTARGIAAVLGTVRSKLFGLYERLPEPKSSALGDLQSSPAACMVFDVLVGRAADRRRGDDLESKLVATEERLAAARSRLERTNDRLDRLLQSRWHRLGATLRRLVPTKSRGTGT
jgi:GT2 family glycosyltransferase